MTCTEFRNLTTNPTPFQHLTTAERVAMANHNSNCEACCDWFIQMVKDMEASLPPLTSAQHQEIDATAIRLLARDVFDPEAS